VRTMATSKVLLAVQDFATQPTAENCDTDTESSRLSRRGGMALHDDSSKAGVLHCPWNSPFGADALFSKGSGYILS
jgi:hypothetical protein